MTHYTAERLALEIIDSGKNLPPLPAVSQRLLVISRQPIDKIDIPSFSKLIEGDPALTVKILQLANSSYYGTIKEIVGIRQAIAHIGLEETLSSVYSFFFKNALPQFPKIEGLSGKDYWDHSWACANANRMLGHPSHSKMVRALPGELYIAGLLHGIGKLFLAIYRPNDFQRCLSAANESKRPLEDEEIKVFGTTDTEIAYNILLNWKFPTHICNAIRYYRKPENAGKESRDIAALTQLAYFIANASGIGRNGDAYEYELSQSYIFQNWVLPAAEKKQQETIIKDIYSFFEKRSPTENTPSEDSLPEKKPDSVSGKTGTTTSQKNTGKKGFMARFLSIFN